MRSPICAPWSGKAKLLASWRASGLVLALRRSGLGLHLVLQCQLLEAGRHRWRNVAFVPVLCPDHSLAAPLERTSREGDLIHLRGYVALCTRPQIPELRRDWDLIVTGARIPRLLNWTPRRIMRRSLGLNRWPVLAGRHRNPGDGARAASGWARSSARGNIA